MLWGSFAEYTRHYPWRVLVIVAGALAAVMLMAAGAPSVHGAETVAVQGGAPAQSRDGNVQVGLPFSASIRLAAVLDTAADGESVAWQDSESGAIYRVLPFYSFSAGERVCRAFTIRRIAIDSIRESYRTACRRNVGGWTLTTASTGGNG
ncbi:MAG: hypothetical protein IH626_12290 [Rhodospirillales bacterium]|nr:hypothetical protein [Rhodospirillales bacterium]